MGRVRIGFGQIANSKVKYKYNEDPGLGKLIGGFLGILFGLAIGGIGLGSKKIYKAP